MKNFAAHIKETIEKEKIAPLPKWVFYGKNITFGIIFLVSVLFGSLAISLILYSLLEGGFEGIRPIHEEILRSIPLLWMISFGIFSAIALWGMKHLPKGYKISTGVFIGGNLFLSFLLGSVLYAVHFPEKFERYEQKIPFHRGIHDKIAQDWNQPEKGFLSGTVQKISGDTGPNPQFIITTPENEEWTIYISERLQKRHERRKKAQHKNPHHLIGKKIKIRGKQLSSEQTFQANEILPWERSRLKPCRGPECEKIFAP